MKQRRNKKEKGLRSQLHFVAARHLSICSTLHICDLLSLISLDFFLPFFFSESHYFRDSFRSSITGSVFLPGSQVLVDSLFSCQCAWPRTLHFCSCSSSSSVPSLCNACTRYAFRFSGSSEATPLPALSGISPEALRPPGEIIIAYFQKITTGILVFFLYFLPTSITAL